MGVFLKEEVSISSFTSWVARKFKGFSYPQITRLTNKVHAITTLQQKHDAQEEINNAIEDNNKELEDVSDVEKIEKLKEVKTVLTKLKSIAGQADITQKIQDEADAKDNKTKHNNIDLND